MLPTLKATRCRAKSRSTCRFHGAEDRALDAIKKSDITAYFDAASELDALRESNWEEGEWAFIRPQNRAVESIADIDELIASKGVLADSYTATFEYGYAMRPRLVRNSAKAAKIAFVETKYPQGVQFDFTAKSKRDLRFLKRLLVHNQQMVDEDKVQAADMARRTR